MLSLQLKSGDYVTIGGNIVVQVYQNGPGFRMAIKAPRDVPILRGDLLERQGGARPEGLHEKQPKAPSRRARDAARLEKLVEKPQD
ncbi:carbon storage regulator [bacterium D16-76]|nr:carbon storage regulator [bacterium D16-76]